MTSKNSIIVSRFYRLFCSIIVLCTALAGCGNGADGPACTTAECQAICKDNPADPVCQPTCSAQTSCAMQNKTCGSIADGCGGTLDCGTCSGWLTCGGGGTANVCGASCRAGCPTGYSCSDRGVCTGGAASGLVLDVKTVEAAGIVTLNGAAPLLTCVSESPATVQFQEVNLGYRIAIPVGCNSTLAFDSLIYPGTYKVTVVGNSYANLPQGSAFVVKSALTITADQAHLVLDVKTVNIAGKVTLNGALPVSTCSSASPATVNLQETTYGYNLNIPVPCGTGFAWSGVVYPGTYKVAVLGNSYANLPQGSAYVVDPALSLTAGRTGLSLDVKTVTLSGKVTLNGATPAATCSSASPATVILQDAAQGYSLSVPVPCNSMFAWSGTVYPGTYKVLVAGNSYSNLPVGSSFVASPALKVSANQTALVLDVKTAAVDGKITLNGAAPTTTCTTSSPASVVFQDTTQGYGFTIAVPCSPAFVWSGKIYPGTYKVSVLGNANANLPTGTAVVVNPALAVSADRAALALDVKTVAMVAIDGTVTLNGAAPTSTCSTSSPASVVLREVTQGYNVTIAVPCSPTFVWSGNVYPGTYKITVTGNTNSNLPQAGAFVANPALVVTAKQSGIVLDVKTVAVTGTLLLDGELPMSSCGSASPATVSFTEINLGYMLNVAVPCSASFAFTGNVYPGTYRIAVLGNSNSNLPQNTPFIAAERLQIP